MNGFSFFALNIFLSFLHPFCMFWGFRGDGEKLTINCASYTEQQKQHKHFKRPVGVQPHMFCIVKKRFGTPYVLKEKGPNMNVYF